MLSRRSGGVPARFTRVEPVLKISTCADWRVPVKLSVTERRSASRSNGLTATLRASPMYPGERSGFCVQLGEASSRMTDGKTLDARPSSGLAPACVVPAPGVPAAGAMGASITAAGLFASSTRFAAKSL